MKSEEIKKALKAVKQYCLNNNCERCEFFVWDEDHDFKNCCLEDTPKMRKTQKELLLRVIKNSIDTIKNHKEIIKDARKRWIDACGFKVGDKVDIIFPAHVVDNLAVKKQGFISNIDCGEDLEYLYSFFAVKKDGTPSKNSLGIWSRDVVLEKPKEEVKK